MDGKMLDAIYEKLKQEVYDRGSNIFDNESPFKKMVIIVQGELESIGANGNKAYLKVGDVCGDELFTSYLEYTSDKKEGGKIQFQGLQLPHSTRTVRCLTNVEAFALHDDDVEEVIGAADLKEVATLFSQLRNPCGQGATRYESEKHGCRAFKWRGYWQKPLKCANIPNNVC